MSANLNFQYVSDLHLEFYKPMDSRIPGLVTPSAPYLLLAGDIAPPKHTNYKYLLDVLSPHYEEIFLTTGNHCYYDKHATHADALFHMKETDETLRNLCATYENVTYLQNQAHHFPNSDVSLFGGTFWTEIPEEAAFRIRTGLNDYNLIPGFTTSLSTQLWTNACEELKATVEESPRRRWIVMSHHMPKMSLILPRYARYGDLNRGFASDIPIADDNRIVQWIYGHTHTPTEQGKFLCNPFGYPGENKIKIALVRLFSVARRLI